MIHLLWLLFFLPKMDMTVRPPDQGGSMSFYMLNHMDAECGVMYGPGWGIYCVSGWSKD